VIELRTEVTSQGAKPGGVGWLGAARRGGGTAVNRWCGGGNGAEMWGLCVSGRGDRRRFERKGTTQKRKHKPVNAP
jgi:hypothetical protein